jgi:putative FmdB family regulatory protein
MPLYEYRCSKCEQVFEVMQKFSDEPLTTHEACGGGVERLVSAPALQFKGSGWYITDYARAGAKAGEGKASSGDSKGESKTESKSESKPSGSSSSGGSSGAPAPASSTK